ncbi:hypothetical protein QG37_04339 [Candidozyma auris]|nr:hypothetical protein QG37_04339 [[Candida] auris]
MISELKLAVNRSGEAPSSIPIYRKWWNHEMRRQKQQRERSREYFELAIHYNVWPMKYLGSYSHAMVITGRFRQKHQQKCQQITETIRLQTHLTISLLTISLSNPFFLILIWQQLISALPKMVPPKARLPQYIDSEL